MTSLRPFQIILIAVFAALGFLGIFIFANYSGGGSSNDKAGTVIIWGTLDSEAVQAGIDEISSGNDRFGEVSYVERPAATFSRDVADAIASGNGPDLLILSQEELVSEKGKLSAIPYSSISERAYIDSYLSIFEMFLSEEGVYGIPLAVDPMVLYYNRTTLASAGVAKAPATWEAISGLAPGVVRRTGDSAVVRALIPFGDYGNVRNARGILSTLLLQAGTPITIEDERGVRSVLADSETVFGRGAAESAITFYTQFADPAKAVYSWNRSLPDSRAMFIAGDLALYPGFSSELPYLLAANPNLDFDMAPIPQPGTSVSRTTYALAYVFALPKASPNPAGALTTAFALAEEKPATAMADTLSMVPALRSVIAKGSSDRYDTLTYPDALVAKGWLSPAPSATDPIFSAMIGNVTSGRMQSAQALQAAGESLNAVLR